MLFSEYATQQHHKMLECAHGRTGINNLGRSYQGAICDQRLSTLALYSYRTLLNSGSFRPTIQRGASRGNPQVGCYSGRDRRDFCRVPLWEHGLFPH